MFFVNSKFIMVLFRMVKLVLLVFSKVRTTGYSPKNFLTFVTD
jgi:hypothetical protein